jgi:hypothetical protein
MNLISMLNHSYNVWIRQESDFTNNLLVGQLKRQRHGREFVDCTEQEFQKLLHICREIAKERPDLLSIDENVSYNDHLMKQIGKHYFAKEPYWNEKKIEEIVAKYFPNE